MVTFEINRLINKRQEIRYLENGTKSLQSRIKVVLKSYKSNMRVDSLASLSAHTVKIQHNNQHRAPPVIIKEFYYTAVTNHLVNRQTIWLSLTV